MGLNHANPPLPHLFLLLSVCTFVILFSFIYQPTNLRLAGHKERTWQLRVSPRSIKINKVSGEDDDDNDLEIKWDEEERDEEERTSSIDNDNPGTMPSHTSTNLTTETSTKPKLILDWTGFFRGDLIGYEGGSGSFRNCPSQRNCVFTKDKRLVEEADAIVFHMRDFKLHDLPPVRHSNQRYIFFLRESPPHTGFNLKLLRNFFNWTITYRLDSDVLTGYGSVWSNLTYSPTKDYMGNRSSSDSRGAIAWVVSNCRTLSLRERLVNILQKKYGLRIDIFGRCSGVQCGDPRSRSSCPDFITSNYLFYLAMENSLCHDYVSEKFFNYINRDIIVIGLAGTNYSSFVPLQSVIELPHTGDLGAVVDEIRTLTDDREKYNEHFRWRENFAGFRGERLPWCGLCEKLHDPAQGPKVYENIHDWWVNGKCEGPPRWT